MSNQLPVGPEGASADAAIADSYASLSVDELQRALKARDQALAVVAHDLRNPLNIIAVNAELLRSSDIPPQLHRRVEQIAGSARRAAALVADLLDVAAIESGKFRVKVESVDLALVILAFVRSQQELAARSSVILSLDLSPSLSPAEADEGRLLEILENLVGNSLKFTKSGGTITIGAREEAGEIVVWVRDTGRGIAPDVLPRIFDRFWNAENRERGGTGLGLGICKAIVEAHGGRIWAESQPGEGTAISFSLPAARESTSGVKRRQPATVLLVDDTPQNLTSLLAILDHPDYRLLTARSGQEALRIALEEPIALAVLDIVMPEMNGFEVASHFKSIKRCRDTPILFVTAQGDDPKTVHQAYEAGGADYLVKPLDPEIVRKKVAVFVNLSQRRAGMPAV
ncbi:MAG TPA: hybrid sensor histidine kinase/response regulator [Polyangiaceae bacterium]